MRDMSDGPTNCVRFLEDDLSRLEQTLKNIRGGCSVYAVRPPQHPIHLDECHRADQALARVAQPFEDPTRQGSLGGLVLHDITYDNVGVEADHNSELALAASRIASSISGRVTGFLVEAMAPFKDATDLVSGTNS
jgi:hypothetical protein